MEKIFSIFTDRQGNPELASICGLIAFGAFIYFGYHHYVTLGKDFDPLGFGGGAGSITALTGGGKLLGNKGDYGNDSDASK